MSSSLLSINSQDDPKALVPNGWRHNQLGRVCDTHGGGRLGLTKEKHYRSSGVLAFSAAGPDGFVQQTEFQDKTGVVLSAIGANCGRCFFASGDWTTLANVQAIIPNSEVDAKYLFYVVNRDGYWERSGSAQPFIKPSTIRSSWVVYPKNISEQTKIAEILSTVDQAIEQTEALIAKQQRIRTGLMQDLLTRGIDEDGNLRSEETHEFKDSPLGRIPVEWEVERCVAVCNEIVVGIVIRPTQYYREYGIPALRSANVRENRIDPSDLVYISAEDNAQLRKSQVRRGDLVTVRTGYPGTTAVIPPEFDGCNCVDIVISRPNPKKVRSKYLSLWVNSDHGKRQILEGQGGLAQQHFNVGEMKNLLVKVPMPDEQERIERLLLAHAETTKETTQDLAKLRRLKTALMQDLLTGQVSVTPLLTEEERNT